jgi:hypothetical protein
VRSKCKTPTEVCGGNIEREQMVNITKHYNNKYQIQNIPPMIEGWITYYLSCANQTIEWKRLLMITLSTKPQLGLGIEPVAA